MRKVNPQGYITTILGTGFYDGDYLLDIRLGGQKLPGSLFLTVQAAK